MIKPLFSALLFLVVLPWTKGQTPPKAFYQKDLGWKITIPENFEPVALKEQERLQDKGHRALENTVGEKVDIRTETIFMFKNDASNYIESNYQSFDVEKDGDYDQIFRLRSDIVFNTFKDKFTGATVDSVLTKEIIDGLVFKVFKTNMHLPNGMVINVIMYGRLFGKKELALSIITTDKDKQAQLLDAWHRSTFEIRD